MYIILREFGMIGEQVGNKYRFQYVKDRRKVLDIRSVC